MPAPHSPSQRTVGPMSLGPTWLGPMSLGPTWLGPTWLGPMSLGPMSLGPMSLGLIRIGPPYLLNHVAGGTSEASNPHRRAANGDPMSNLAKRATGNKASTGEVLAARSGLIAGPTGPRQGALRQGALR